MSDAVTLITPSLNGGRYLGQALASIRRQGARALEHIIVDAGSSDNTADLAGAAAQTIMLLEPGSSSHEAMNIGLERAQGAIVGFLNTDDVLPPGAIERVRAAFKASPNAAAVYGGAAFFRADRMGAPSWGHVLSAPTPADLPSALFFLATCFNAWFFRRDVFGRIGGFDRTYNFSADREFLIRLTQAEIAVPVEAVLCCYRMHEHSRTMSQDPARTIAWLKEHLRLGERMAATARTNERRALIRRFEAFERARLGLYEARAGRPVAAMAKLMAEMLARPDRLLELGAGLKERQRLYRRYLDRTPSGSVSDIAPDAF